MLIGGGLLGVAVLVVALVVSGNGGTASAQSVSTDTALPPVTSGSQVIVDGILLPCHGAQISSPAGGMVEEVLVAEGDTVETGQVLVALSGRHQAEAEVAAADLELLSAQKAQEDLRRDKGILLAQAALDEAVARKAAEEARARVWDSTSTAEKEKMQDAREWLEAMYGRYQYLQSVDDGSTSSLGKTEKAYRDYIQAAQAYQAAESDYNNSLVSGGSDTSTAAADVSRAEYELARARWESALAELNRLNTDGPATELAMADARVLSAEKRAAAAQAALEALELRAPFAGVVADLNVKIGEYAAPGMEVAAVADLSTWEVETTDLGETDVTRIALGDKAVLTFDAVPGLELPAEVVRISQLGKEYQGETTYRVTLKVEGNDGRLLWNMTVMVKIGD
jgi:multidrug resistance efflux pump